MTQPKTPHRHTYQGCNDGFFTTGCLGSQLLRACIKKTTTQPEIRGGSMLIHPFVSFPSVSFRFMFVIYVSLGFASFHSVTHSLISSSVPLFVHLRVSIVVVSSLPLSPVTSTSYTINGKLRHDLGKRRFRLLFLFTAVFDYIAQRQQTSNNNETCNW